jgi:three-Cys-motif partner protein
MANNNFTGQLFGGSWTEKKLEILKRYLEAYTKALKNQPFKKIYIDAFAGTGYRKKQKKQFEINSLFEEIEQEEDQFLKGSARLALEAKPSFDKYIFIENDEGKIGELQKLKSEYSSIEEQIQIEQQDANEFIQNYCVNENWKENRAVLFLDPFATQVDWVTIEAIAKTQSIDVWILFPIMAVNRLLANDPQKIWYNILNRIFGTEEWFQNFYTTQILNDIFGETEEKILRACNPKKISEFYNKRLGGIFNGVARNPKVLYNSRNSPLFLFFFAAGNPKGAPIAIKIAEYLIRNI